MTSNLWTYYSLRHIQLQTPWMAHGMTSPRRIPLWTPGLHMQGIADMSKLVKVLAWHSKGAMKWMVELADIALLGWLGKCLNAIMA